MRFVSIVVGEQLTGRDPQNSVKWMSMSLLSASTCVLRNAT